MLTFLSPCHRCSVLRQLGCKDGKNWNSKYVISWYMWHKINNTFLSLPSSRCIRIHCFSWGRGGLFAFSSLELHIFVSKLLIDLYLDKPQQWNICRIQKEGNWSLPEVFFFQMMSCLSQGHLEVWNLFPYLTCEGVPILRQLRPMHRKL